MLDPLSNKYHGRAMSPSTRLKIYQQLKKSRLAATDAKSMGRDIITTIDSLSQEAILSCVCRSGSKLFPKIENTLRHLDSMQIRDRAHYNSLCNSTCL